MKREVQVAKFDELIMALLKRVDTPNSQVV